ncbi:Hypothetical predicted protein [Pelobates cultripes]|uniref:Uncharacterized protein n=1 Tax=Pelobates cultripes TaxID=61616 RepID=A0AAD1RFM7_PELCU|nr:Hypothetical predicted protein [Pelobates cultripes]
MDAVDKLVEGIRELMRTHGAAWLKDHLWSVLAAAQDGGGLSRPARSRRPPQRLSPVHGGAATGPSAAAWLVAGQGNRQPCWLPVLRRVHGGEWELPLVTGSLQGDAGPTVKRIDLGWFPPQGPVTEVGCHRGLGGEGQVLVMASPCMRLVPNRHLRQALPGGFIR